MITRFRVQNFKTLRDVTLELTPLHVLIGPNDSGKTSLLEAMAALCRSTSRELKDAFLGQWDGDVLVATSAKEPLVSFEASLRLDRSVFDYHLAVRFPSAGRGAQVESESGGGGHAQRPDAIRPPNWGGNTAVSHMSRTHVKGHDTVYPIIRAVRAALDPVVLVHWTARNLALPSALNPSRRHRLEASGFGLPALLDTILSEDRKRFDALETHFRRIFPQVESIQIPQSPAFDAPVDPSDNILQLKPTIGKAISFRFDGQSQPIPASQVSDGLLYVLGYLSLLYSPEPPKVLLIEEPENGIHPNRLKEVLAILRELIQEHPETQVVMTTHSPYVIDEFSPEEVTLCRRQDDGTITVKRLSESETVRKQLDLFTLGEIWAAEGDEAIAADLQEAAQP